MTEIADTDGSLEAAAGMIRQKFEAVTKKETADSAQTPHPGNGTNPIPGKAMMPDPDDETPPAPAMVDADETEGDADDTGEGDDAPATIAPEAPSNWNQADKDWFKALDPVRQDFILRHQKGTQAAEARRQNEHRAALEQLAQQAQQTAQERQQFAAAIQNYADPLVRDYQRDFADVLSGKLDPLRLAESNPQRWAKYQAYQAKFQQIATTRQALAARAQAEQQQQFGQYLAVEEEKLLEALPDIKEPAKRQKFNQELTGYLQDAGFSETRISMAGAAELVTAYKAMLWDRAQSRVAAKPAAEPGKVAVKEHQRTAPKVLKPGAGGNSGTGDEKIVALETRAKKSGSIDDVAALMRAKLQRAAARA